MGLFSGRKSDEHEDDEKAIDPPKPAANPLLPPSAQRGTAGLTRLPSGSAARTGSKGGPTPPGGLLPRHAEDEIPTVDAPSRGRGSAASSPSNASGELEEMPATSMMSPSGGAATPAPISPPPAPRHQQHSPERVPAPRLDVAGMPAEAHTLIELLREAVERGASDLHLTRGVPPTIRLDGMLMALDAPALTRESCERLVMSVLNPLQRQKFQEDWELDLSLDLPEAGRFRVNIHRQRGGIEAAFRVVNEVILPLRRLGLPGVVEEISRKHHGLVLVSGPTGSGKSTTLASMVDQINNERQCMVITIEDPIEYVHRNKRCIIKQREVTSDTKGFAQALRHVLRQDPDVIVVGELRDLETISTALMAAETGHLVFATLHTPDATQTIDRMIDVFPPHQQEQARIQVANTLQAVIAQQLLPVPGNRGRVVGVEILIATVAVRKIVRSGKSEQLYTTMQTSWEQGMITMDKSLKTLYQQGLISFDDAISRCKFPMEFDNI